MSFRSSCVKRCRSCPCDRATSVADVPMASNALFEKPQTATRWQVNRGGRWRTTSAISLNSCVYINPRNAQNQNIWHIYGKKVLILLWDGFSDVSIQRYVLEVSWKHLFAFTLKHMWRSVQCDPFTLSENGMFCWTQEDEKKMSPFWRQTNINEQMRK